MTTAARLYEHGAPLRVEDVPLAEPGPADVVVEMRYAGVNPIDRYGALGRVAADGPRWTLGGEGVGQLGDRLVLARGSGLGQTRDGLGVLALTPLRRNPLMPCSCRIVLRRSLRPVRNSSR